MISKISEKEKVIELRKQGKSYSDIRRIVPVAKSTISLWLKKVQLSNFQNQTLTDKKLAAAKRGGEVKKQQRIHKQKSLLKIARKDIGNISDRELFLIGAVLYWAEGSKEKDFAPGSQLVFSNMDPRMIKVFLCWLKEICAISDDRVHIELYIHDTHLYRLEEIKDYWMQQIKFPKDRFDTVYIKRSSRHTNRRNVTENSYFGSLRIKIRKSSEIVRKLAGWAEGIYDAMGT